MKTSCLPVSFFPELSSGKMTLGEWACTASRVGLDGFDVSSMHISNHTPVYMQKTKMAFEAARLPVVMVVTYPDFTCPDEVQRDRELEYLRQDIATGSYFGAKYIRILAGQAHPETSVAKGLGWVLENFKKAAETAQRFGVQLVFENHSKPGAWNYVDFSHPTELFLEIAAGIEGTGIGINFDTANTLVYGDDPLQVLERVADRVVTIHAADTLRRGHLDPVLLGQGIVPFKEIFQVLKQHHFDGWICIEEASKSGEEGVRKAMEFVRDTWDEA
jgi:sugar phosphate isomerase/epimerase